MKSGIMLRSFDDVFKLSLDKTFLGESEHGFYLLSDNKRNIQLTHYFFSFIGYFEIQRTW